MSASPPNVNASERPRGSVIRRVLRVTLGVVIGLPVVLVALLFGCQRRMIFLAREYDPIDARGLPAEVEAVPAETSEGRQVAFYVPPQAGGDPAQIWLVFGGNASLALDFLEWIAAYPERHTGFLLIDYPGYGQCEGHPSRAAILESSEALAAAITARFPSAELDCLGHSIGVAAALDLAARHPARRVVAVSPFTSLADMARRVVGWPLCNFVRDRFDNRARLDEIAEQSPRPAMTIIHGEADDIIPVRMGRELAARHSDWIAYREIHGADHNWILDMARDEIFAAMTSPEAP